MRLHAARRGEMLCVARVGARVARRVRRGGRRADRASRRRRGRAARVARRRRRARRAASQPLSLFERAPAWSGDSHARERSRRARRLQALPPLRAAHADRVRRRQSARRADVRRRGPRRRGGPHRAPVRRARRRAPDRDDREGPRDPAARRLHLQHREVSAAGQPHAARRTKRAPAAPSSTVRSPRCGPR